MVAFNIKEMIYKNLNPIAKAFGFKVLILDYDSYSSYGKKLNAKLNALNLSKDSIDDLNDALSTYQFVAILKNNRYVPYGDVLSAFSKYGMRENDLRSLGTKQSEDKPFGMFDDSIPENKRQFFYWFPIEIEDVD